MRLTIAAVCLLALAAVAQAAAPRQDWKSDLLSAREAVWVNYYSDPYKLAAGLSDDLITISGRGSGFEGKGAAIASSRRAVGNDAPTTLKGEATEFFVWRDGAWLHTG